MAGAEFGVSTRAWDTGGYQAREATELSMGCDAVQEAENQGFLGPGVSLVSGRSCGDELGQQSGSVGEGLSCSLGVWLQDLLSPTPWSTLSALPWVKQNALSASILEGSGTFCALP